MKTTIHGFVYSLILVVVASNASAQDLDTTNPIFDSQKVHALINSGEEGQTKTILDAYGAGAKNNVLLKHVFAAVDTNSAKSLESADALGQSGSSALFGTAGIDALGTLIADRFREELTLSFLNAFRERLKKDVYLGNLFANAKRVLLYDDPFNYNSWLPSFRRALDMDLRNLPDNIPSLLEAIKSEHDAMLTDKQMLVLNVTLAAYKPLVDVAESPHENYEHIKTLLTNLAGVDNINDHTKASLKWSRIILTECGNESQTNWASANDFKALLKMNIARTFLGLLVEKYKTEFKGIQLSNGKDLYTFLHSDPSESEWSVYVDYVKQVANNVGELKKTISGLESKKAREGSLSYNDMIPVIHQSLGLLNELADSSTWASMKIPISDSVSFEEISSILRSVNHYVGIATSVHQSIEDRDYAQLLPDLLVVLQDVFGDATLENSKFLQDVLKYGNLAVNIVSAETPEELSSALENSILPAQSYRLKRNSHFSITINSYAGGFWGEQRLRNREADEQFSSIAAFTAPVGIGLNWGLFRSSSPTKLSRYPAKVKFDTLGKRSKVNYFSGWSASLFFSAVDIGAVTVFRLNNAETPIENVQWADVLAPGAHVIIGLGNTPLSLGFGAQYGPALKKVQATDKNGTTSIVNSSAWRFGASLTVDIPLYQLYVRQDKTKAEKKKKKQ